MWRRRSVQERRWQAYWGQDQKQLYKARPGLAAAQKQAGLPHSRLLQRVFGGQGVGRPNLAVRGPGDLDPLSPWDQA